LTAFQRGDLNVKIKTSELTRAALNWAVAQVRQLPLDDLRTSRSVVFYLGEPWMPDIYWEQGGPIIEEERIGMVYVGFEQPDDKQWVAMDKTYGPTPLVAAMRFYVASRLGDEVDVPDQLLEVLV
jgi:hypothetical protein